MKKSILRKSLVVGIIGLFIGTGVGATIFESPSCSPQQLTRGWLYVGGSGPGNYTKIQDAIDNASDGDTVFVFQGTYYENVIVNKSIHLLGENRNNTIIHNTASSRAVNIMSPRVNLSYFTIKSNYVVVYIESGNTTISNNTIVGTNNFSSGIMSQSNSSTINQNVIYSSYRGIFLRVNSKNNVIINNEIISPYYVDESSGIYIDNASSNNVLLKNKILGYHVGIGFLGCDNNIIKENIIKTSSFGIMLLNSRQNKILYNHIEITGNRGIYVAGRNFNFITNNNFIGPEKWFVYVGGGFIFAPLNYWGPNVFFPGITKTDGGIAFCFPWRVKPVDINV